MLLFRCVYVCGALMTISVSAFCQYISRSMRRDRSCHISGRHISRAVEQIGLLADVRLYRRQSINDMPLCHHKNNFERQYIEPTSIKSWIQISLSNNAHEVNSICRVVACLLTNYSSFILLIVYNAKWAYCYACTNFRYWYGPVLCFENVNEKFVENDQDSQTIEQLFLYSIFYRDRIPVTFLYARNLADKKYA